MPIKRHQWVDERGEELRENNKGWWLGWWNFKVLRWIETEKNAKKKFEYKNLLNFLENNQFFDFLFKIWGYVFLIEDQELKWHIHLSWAGKMNHFNSLEVFKIISFYNFS